MSKKKGGSLGKRTREEAERQRKEDEEMDAQAEGGIGLGSGPTPTFGAAYDDPPPESDGDSSSHEEAIEERSMVHDEDLVSDEGEGEELLGPGMERDYRAIPELDIYEAEAGDRESHEELDLGERLQVERDLAERDRAEGRIIGHRLPDALYEDIGESEDEELMRNIRREHLDREEEGEAFAEDRYIDPEEYRGRAAQWIQQPRTIRWIRRHFESFLSNFRDGENGDMVYEPRIIQMCSQNLISLPVTYTHLSTQNPTLALWVAEEPALMLPILNEVAFRLVLHLFPSYDNVTKHIFVRIRDLPIEDSIRDLRQNHLNELIRISGVITKRSSVYPQLQVMYFICSKCGDRKGPIYHHDTENIRLGACILCQSNGPFTLDVQETLYRNYQKITIQETPGTVPAGRVPRQKEVILLNDLVDKARPGDQVEITGIYKNRFEYLLNARHGFPVFATVIEANYMRTMSDISYQDLTEDDKHKIREMSRRQDIGELVFRSVAPSIFGHIFVKRALTLAMFGGVSKDVGGKHKIRGDINVLLLGDPGTAKSQFLKYVEKSFHRCVYTTGKGASAVGLTAGVHKDPLTQEWVLEGGALVLADKGICLIDEFDKMNEQDRTSIHEAMEQQSISISKAGIVTSLHARCSVIAAANPVKGRYDTQRNFADNVDLTEPILSRFDILSVVKDEVDSETDRQLATFVINSHIRSHPLAKEHPEETKSAYLPTEDQLESYNQNILRKYIMYARKFINPKLTDIDRDRITTFYTMLRKESQAVGGMQIGVRHIESILRMAEAHARMHLREFVHFVDLDMGIQMMLGSFLQSHKFSIRRALETKFQKFMTLNRDTNELLIHILARIIDDKAQYQRYVKNRAADYVQVTKEQLEKEAREVDVYELDAFYRSNVFKAKYSIHENKYIRKPQV